MRADHQRQAAECDEGCKRAAPAELVQPRGRAADAGQDRVDEVCEHRDRHRDRLDGLEDAENVGRKEHAEAERHRPLPLRMRARGRREMQPGPHEPDADEAPEGDQRQHVRPRSERDLAEDVRRTEGEGCNDPGQQVREHQRARRRAVPAVSTSLPESFTP